MKRKIFRIFIFVMILLPVLSSIVIAGKGPALEIVDIYGRTKIFRGATVVIEIKNNGDEDAYNVTWSLCIKHPIFKKLNISTDDIAIDLIKARDTAKETAGLSWIGRFELTIKAYVPGGNSVSKTVRGFQIFSFIIIFPK